MAWGQPLTSKKAPAKDAAKKRLSPEEEETAKMRQQLMDSVAANDPLRFIYQDIADYYDPGEFKDKNHDISTGTSRHQRLKIIGFKVLIPVQQPCKPTASKDYSIYKEQFARLAWISELVCHSRPYLAKLNVGAYLSKCMQREPIDDLPDPVDLNDRSLVTYYTQAQAQHFSV